MNKFYALSTWVLAAALFLSACATPATPTPETAPQATAPQAAAPTQSGFVDVPRNQTVIFENIDGRVPVPDNFNPYISGQYLDWGFWQANQESLFYENLENGKIEPWQAESYEFNADNTEVTIKIRDGVKWSDGEPFTADDVVFTINMLKAHPELQYSAEMTQWVKDVVAKDPRTVVFTLTGANARFINDYFSVRIWDTVLIAPKHIWEGQDPLTFKNFDLEKGLPVGTGPYKMVRSTETETVFDLRDSWWAAETGFHAMPAPKRAIWIGVGSEEVRAAKAANNELDAMWLFGRSTFETTVQKNPNIVGWTKDLPYAYLDACPRFLAVNNEFKPFDDPEIRWALNYAINRDQIIQIAWEGMTDPAATLFPTYAALDSFLKRNEPLFQKYPVLTNDTAKTDEIMTGKGYTKNGDGLWVGADKKPITFTIITRSGETDKVKMGPVIVDQLRAAGFDVDFQPLESAVFFDEESKGTVGAYLSDICASVTDPYNVFARFHSRNYVPLGESMPTNPAVRYKNAELDTLVDQMAGMSPADPQYDGLADKALEIMVRDMPIIPLVQARLLTPFNNTYWTNWPTSDNNYIHPGHWWVTGGQILINLKPAG